MVTWGPCGRLLVEFCLTKLVLVCICCFCGRAAELPTTCATTAGYSGGQMFSRLSFLKVLTRPSPSWRHHAVSYQVTINATVLTPIDKYWGRILFSVPNFTASSSEPVFFFPYALCRMPSDRVPWILRRLHHAPRTTGVTRGPEI